MKIKWSTNKLVNIIVISFAIIFGGSIALTYWSLSGTHTYSGTDPDFANNLMEDAKPIDSAVSMELPYYKYISKRDSIKNIRNFKNENIPTSGGFQVGDVLGITGSYILCDTCTIRGYWTIVKSENKQSPTQYFLKLPAWKLKSSANNNFYDDSVRFYMEHNKGYVRKIVLDKYVKNKNGIITNYRRFIDMPVRFGYDQRTQSLMIPVSKTTRDTVNIILGIYTLAFIICILYLIASFLKFVVDLSKGFAFIPQNVARLKLIACSLLIYPIAMFLLALLMKLLFYTYFTSDVILNNAIWIDSWKPLVVGMIFFLLYKAFKQGKLLKDEQDLTV